MKIKTSDLTGAALDWAVAEADGLRPYWYKGSVWVLDGKTNKTLPQFSADWAQGGPLLERHLFFLEDQGDGVWGAEGVGGEPEYGLTPLIAICRAVVCCKLGDEVDVPDELVQPCAT